MKKKELPKIIIKKIITIIKNKKNLNRNLKCVKVNTNIISITVISNGLFMVILFISLTHYPPPPPHSRKYIK